MRLYWLLVICVFVVGRFLDAYHFDVGHPWYRDNNVNITDIAVHTGDLWISPFGSEQQLLDLFESASERIYIQSYLFTNKRLLQALKRVALADSGLDIRIVLESHPYQSYRDDFGFVVDYFSGLHNVSVVSDEHLWVVYLHAKLTIIDDVYIVQTANLTHSSFATNREHFLVWQDPVLLENLVRYFLADYEGSSYEYWDDRIVVCPVWCREVIQTLLRQAQSSIIIQTQYITDPVILDILEHSSVSDMRFLVAKVESNDPVLYYFGPAIARYLPKPYNHTKMILIDNRILLVWSINLSEHSMDSNRELGLFITDPSVIATFMQQFERDWAVWQWKRK